MKKLLITLGSVSIVSIPVILVTSCSTTPSKTIDFKEQYNLFTNNLLIKEEVSKNLRSAILIDNNLIQKIYTPPTLAPNISYIFSVEADANDSLKLFVEIYDEKNNLVKFSETSNKKEIMIISGFNKLTSDQQLNINVEKGKFDSLTIKANRSNLLPSSVNDIKLITENTFDQKDEIYNYDWIFNPNDNEGKLSFSLILKDKNDYPIEKFDSEIISGFQTTIEYQKMIDDMYNLVPADINLSEEKYNTIKLFASSIVNNVELYSFYDKLNAIPGILEADRIKIPPFITNPTSIPGFYVDISIDSYDRNGRLTLFTSIYNAVTGEMLLPTKSSFQSRTINNFKKAEEIVDGKKVDNDELLKAIMDAYDKFSVYQLDNSKPADAVYKKTLPTTSNYKIQDLINSFVESLDGTVADGTFKITVDNFIITTPKIVEPPAKKTFTFRVKFDEKLLLDNENGSIMSKINIEYMEENEWFLVRPSSRLTINDNGTPNFSKTRNKNELVVSGFLTNQLSNANALYEHIGTILTANKKQFTSTVAYNEFDKTNFDTIWKSLSTNVADQLGIKFTDIENHFSIKYEFVKDPLNSSEYKITESVGLDGLRIKTISIKAIVSLFNNPEFDFEFLNINGLPAQNFEFNFSIKQLAS